MQKHLQLFKSEDLIPYKIFNSYFSFSK